MKGGFPLPISRRTRKSTLLRLHRRERKIRLRRPKIPFRDFWSLAILMGIPFPIPTVRAKSQILAIWLPLKWSQPTAYGLSGRIFSQKIRRILLWQDQRTSSLFREPTIFISVAARWNMKLSPVMLKVQDFPPAHTSENVFSRKLQQALITSLRTYQKFIS